MNMEPTPKGKPGLLEGLTKILHLHKLPATETQPMSSSPTPLRSRAIPPVNSTHSPTERPAKQPIPPVDYMRKETPTVSASPAPSLTKPILASLPSVAKVVSILKPTPSPPPSSGGPIITDYDRILDLVRSRGSMKLDEIARLLALPEEPVAQELQTLEDNGLVDVKYPAFGEPVIFYKKPEGN